MHGSLVFWMQSNNYSLDNTKATQAFSKKNLKLELLTWLSLISFYNLDNISMKKA